MSKPKTRLQTAALSNDSPAQEMSDNACDIEEASVDGSPEHISQPFPHRSPPRELTAELQQPGMPSHPDWVTGFEYAIKHDIAQQRDGIKAGQRAIHAQLATPRGRSGCFVPYGSQPGTATAAWPPCYGSVVSGHDRN